MLFSQRKLQENKDNSFSTFFVKTNKNIDSKIQHKVGHVCHVCTMLKVSGHFTRVLKFGPETIYLVLNMMKDSFFCLRFYREILNIFAMLLCCPVSGHNNNNVIIHKVFFLGYWCQREQETVSHPECEWFESQAISLSFNGNTEFKPRFCRWLQTCKPLYRGKTVYSTTNKTAINRPIDHTGET